MRTYTLNFLQRAPSRRAHAMPRRGMVYPFGAGGALSLGRSTLRVTRIELRARPAVKRTQVALEPNLKCWSCLDLCLHAINGGKMSTAKVGHRLNKATPDSC